jgi:DNA-directed RNA polymerase subunit RPC12/RpoP
MLLPTRLLAIGVGRPDSIRTRPLVAAPVSLIDSPPVVETERSVMSKQEMREEAERLIKEAMEKKSLAVKQGQTRIETKCGKCGAPNRISAAPGQGRVEFACKECGHKQKAL